MSHSSSPRAVTGTFGALALAALAALGTACGGSSANGASGANGGDDSCACDIEVNGDKQTLSCGQSACIGGSTWSCGSQGSSQTSASCPSSSTDNGSSSSSSGSSGASSPPASGSTSSSSSSGSDTTDYCATLATFCSDKCSSPANVNEDCVSNANAGDQKKCALWTGYNGQMCKP